MPGFAQTLHEWGQGKLHSGSTQGPVVKDQKQALAIAFSEQRKGKESTAKRVGAKLLQGR